VRFQQLERRAHRKTDHGRFGLAIKSIQEQQIVACGKHFIVNEQETNRTDQGKRPDFRTNSIVDDRTMHELYLWPWYDGVANGMGSAMCVMNRVNGEIGCENGHLMNELLRDQLGFNGKVIANCLAETHKIY
jgi:beta-glucosidase